MTIVINEFNYDKFFEIAELASELELETLSFRLLQDPDQMCSFSDKEMIRKIIEDLRSLRNREISIKLDFNLNELKKYYEDKENTILKREEEPYCLYHFFEMAIFADGTVSSCYYLNDKESFLTEFVRRKSLKEIWRGVKFKYLRESNLLNEASKPCKNCEISSKERQNFKNDFKTFYSPLSSSEINEDIKTNFESLKKILF